MVSEPLVVRAVSKDGRQAEVVGVRQAACSGCAARVGCGHGVLRKQQSLQPFTVPISPPHSALAAGDELKLTMPANDLLRLAFRAYVQPLLLAMVSVTFVSRFAPEQAGLQVLVMLASLMFGAWWSLTRSSRQQDIAHLLEISKSDHTKAQYAPPVKDVQ